MSERNTNHESFMSVSMRNDHSGVKSKHDRSEYGGLPRHSFSLIKRNESGLNLDCSSRGCGL